MSDPLRPRSWVRPQFSLGTLLWMMLVVGMGIAWWNDRRQFDLRLQKLEQIYSPTPQTWGSAGHILGKMASPTHMGRSATKRAALL